MPIIPIFVSSTFRDFHNERDALRHHVLGALNERLAPLGSRLELVDLRWGASTSMSDEDERSARVLDVCLDELRQTEPLLIGLVGDRFGWVPSADAVAQAVGRAGFPPAPAGLSLTALELHFGVLQHDNPDAVVLVRDLDGDIPPSWHEQEHAEEVAELREHLTDEQRTKATVRRYPATATADGQVDVDAFVEVAIEALDGPVRRRASALKQAPHRYQAAEALLLEDRRGLAGHCGAVLRIVQELEEGRSVVLHGPAGIGKTTVWCQVLDQLRADGRTVLSIALGETPSTSSLLAALQELLVQLHPGASDPSEAFTGITDRKVLQQRLQQLLRERLQRPGVGLVLVDGLDRLPASDANDLAALLAMASGGVSFLVTSRQPDLPADILSSRRGGAAVQRLALGALGPDDAARAFTALAASHGRPVVPEAVRERIARRERSPLWVVTAELALNTLGREEYTAAYADSDDTGDSHEQLLAHTVEQLPDDDVRAMGEMLARLAPRFPDGALRRFSTLLSLSRHGLTPAELAGAASLLPLEVSSIRYALGGLVRIRNLDGAVCLDLTHEATRRHWLDQAAADEQQALRARLAEQLLAQPLLFQPSDGTNIELRQRGRVELFWQLLSARRFADANRLFNHADGFWVVDRTLLRLAEVLAELRLPDEGEWDFDSIEVAGLLAIAHLVRLRIDLPTPALAAFERRLLFSVSEQLDRAMEEGDGAVAHEVWEEAGQIRRYVVHVLTRELYALEEESEKARKVGEVVIAHLCLQALPLREGAGSDPAAVHRLLMLKVVSLTELIGLHEMHPDQIDASALVSQIRALLRTIRDRDLNARRPVDRILLQGLRGLFDLTTEHGRFSVREQREFRHSRSRLERRFGELPQPDLSMIFGSSGVG